MKIADVVNKHTNATKALFGVVIGVAIFAQFPLGERLMRSAAQSHPHLSSLLTLLVGAGFLLMRPNVQAKIKSATGIDLAAEQSKLQQQGENLQKAKQEFQQAAQQGTQAIDKAKQITEQPQKGKP